MSQLVTRPGGRSFMPLTDCGRDTLAQARRSVSTSTGEVLGEVSAELRANLADGPVQLFTPYRLSAQAMEVVRTKDSGTLQYDIYLNDDESECMVIEQYKDSAAPVEHSENLGDLSEAIPCNGLRGSPFVLLDLAYQLQVQERTLSQPCSP
jgi:quinol monooxygenase YgiN